MGGMEEVINNQTFVKMKTSSKVDVTPIESQNVFSCKIQSLPESVIFNSLVQTTSGIFSCGGYRSGAETNKCYHLSSDLKWTPFYNMQKKKSFLNLNVANKMLVNIGGTEEDSLEFINFENGLEWKTKKLPFTISGHCSVSINDKEIMVIGGTVNGLVRIKDILNHFRNILDFSLFRKSFLFFLKKYL